MISNWRLTILESQPPSLQSDSANPPTHTTFYNVTLKNFAAPWTNEAQTVFTPLNDYSATVIGTIRDGLDFRRILYDDLLYIGNAGVTPALFQ